MATYKAIQQRVKNLDGFVPKTCWIAHVLSDHGLVTRAAPNRIDAKAREYPCPAEKRSAIEAALRHFGMV
jgi:hypothetical protein